MTEPEILHRDQNHTRDWLRANAAEGLLVAVHHGHGGFQWFEADRIVGINTPTKGRIYLERHGAFYFTGTNCFHPKGQIWLPIPTEERLAVASQPVHWYLGERKNGWGPASRLPL